MLREMKLMFAFLVILASCVVNFKAETPKPFRSVDLTQHVPLATDCDNRSIFPNDALWIDNEHLVVWLITICKSHEGKWNSTNELLFVASKGTTQVLQPGVMGGLSRGPKDTILVGHGSAVDAVRANLQVVQTLQCPEPKPCAIYPAPSGSTDSDFALCSTSRPTEHCVLYKGIPAERLSQMRDVPMSNGVIPESPYPNVAIGSGLPSSSHADTAWRVSENEVWFFDAHGVLTSLSVARSTAPVSSERWCPKDSSCDGEFSFISKRFLASCVGAHLYTDGEFDSIFGYSRIALFDVPSKRLLLRIDGRPYTSATLSPNGKRVATIHRGSDTKIEVKLYQVD